jgi:hypothetical protein
MIREMTDAEARALPVSVDVETAGRAWDMGRPKSYELARQGKFPCRVVTVGPKYRVPKSALLEALGIVPAGAQVTAGDAA